MFQVLRMSSTLVHLEQFEKVGRQMNSVESRFREPFVTVKAFQQWRERTTLDFGGMQLRLSELQQEVRTLIASPQFGGDPPHDDLCVAHYESQVSIFLQQLDAMSHDLHSCKARLDACEKKYTYLETQMGQFESSYSPLARVIPELQSAISNSIKVQGLGGREYLGILDTAATISIVAKKILPRGDLKTIMPTAAIRMGDGHLVHSCGQCEVDVPLGSRSIAHRFYVMDTEAFDFGLVTDFFVEHSQILSLTLQAPYVLQVDHGDGGESVPLEQSEHSSSYLRVSL